MRGLFLEPIDTVIQEELRRRRKILSADSRISAANEGANFEWTDFFGKTKFLT